MWNWLNAAQFRLANLMHELQECQRGVQAALDPSPVLEDYRRHPELKPLLFKTVSICVSLAAVGSVVNHAIADEPDAEPSMLTTVAQHSATYLVYVFGLAQLGAWSMALCREVTTKPDVCAQERAEKASSDYAFLTLSEMQLSIQYLPVPYLKWLMLPMVMSLNSMGLHNYGHHPQSTERSHGGYFKGFVLGQHLLLELMERLLSTALDSQDVTIITNTTYLLSALFLIHRSRSSELPEVAVPNRVDEFEPARRLGRMVEPLIKRWF